MNSTPTPTPTPLWANKTTLEIFETYPGCFIDQDRANAVVSAIITRHAAPELTALREECERLKAQVAHLAMDPQTKEAACPYCRGEIGAVIGHATDASFMSHLHAQLAAAEQRATQEECRAEEVKALSDALICARLALRQLVPPVMAGEEVSPSVLRILHEQYCGEELPAQKLEVVIRSRKQFSDLAIEALGLRRAVIDFRHGIEAARKERDEKTAELSVLRAQLAAAERERDEAKRDHESAAHIIDTEEAVNTQLRATLAAVTKERDSMDKMLQRVANEAFGLDDTIEGEPYDDYFLRQVGKTNAALAATETARAVKNEALENALARLLHTDGHLPTKSTNNIKAALALTPAACSDKIKVLEAELELAHTHCTARSKALAKADDEVTAARTAHSEAVGLLWEAHNGLDAWTRGYAESSQALVCNACEKKNCREDCDCNRLMQRISQHLAAHAGKG